MSESWPKIPVSKTIFLAFLTIVIFAIVFRTFHFDPRLLTQVNWYYWSLAALCALTFPLLGTTRWWYILKALKVEVSLKKVFELTFGTWALSILPGRIGNFLRIAGIKNEARLGVLFSSVLLENVKDVLVLLLIALTGMLIIGEHTYALFLLIAIAGLITCLFVPRFISKIFPKVGSKIMVVDETLFTLLKEPRYFSLAVLSSILNWVIYMIHTDLLFLAVGVTLPLGAVMAWMPLAMFVGLIPVTLGGMGTRDAALIYFFSHFASPNQIITVGLWYSLLGYWFLAILGLPWLRTLLVKFRD